MIATTYGLHFQWKSFWMFNYFNSQVNVKLRPEEMAWTRLLNINYFPNRCIFKPGEIPEGHKEFPSP